MLKIAVARPRHLFAHVEPGLRFKAYKDLLLYVVELEDGRGDLLYQKNPWWTMYMGVKQSYAFVCRMCKALFSKVHDVHEEARCVVINKHQVNVQ